MSHKHSFLRISDKWTYRFFLFLAIVQSIQVGHISLAATGCIDLASSPPTYAIGSPIGSSPFANAMWFAQCISSWNQVFANSALEDVFESTMTDFLSSILEYVRPVSVSPASRFLAAFQ